MSRLRAKMSDDAAKESAQIDADSWRNPAQVVPVPSLICPPP